MNFLDVLLGREQKMDEAEENLGRPDDKEAQDLTYHVSRCAVRWILSYRMSRQNNAQIAQVRLLLIVWVALELIQSPEAGRVLSYIVSLAGVSAPH